MISTVQANWQQLLGGLKITVELSVFGGALAFVIAVVLGLAAMTRFAVLRMISRIIVEFFRGTSLVVQLFFLVFVTPVVFGWGSHPLVFAFVALGLNYGAYGSEVVRGALTAVPKEQWECTTALSMPWVTKIRRIIWPQAWALMLPGLNSLMVMLVKGTAIALFIGLLDLTSVSDNLQKQGAERFTVYGISFVLYYLLAMAFSAFLRRIEVRAQRRLGLKPTKTDTNRATAGALA
ncbi:amino acid ABC transporter permease [Leekyejoonella antrihumi]|uniref:Amino acid ABC transporter permease n=1 Tax=Leekyejoonella antrihumi TaxID=1660198 RepID=A0A563E9G5_9MICO|nr:amino acid ABC transporter permease [Leekyejoonella antrihumi]